MNFLAKRSGVLYDLKQMMKQALRNTKIKMFFAGLAIIVGAIISYNVSYASYTNCNKQYGDVYRCQYCTFDQDVMHDICVDVTRYNCYQDIHTDGKFTCSERPQGVATEKKDNNASEVKPDSKREIKLEFDPNRPCESYPGDDTKKRCAREKELAACAKKTIQKDIDDCMKKVNQKGEYKEVIKQIQAEAKAEAEKKKQEDKDKPAAPNIPTGPCGPGTSLIKCDSNQDPISYLIKTVINFLTTLIFVIAPLMLVVAGVVYATAADSAERVNLAKTIIKNVIIGVVLYMLLTIILHFLVPGGVI